MSEEALRRYVEDLTTAVIGKDQTVRSVDEELPLKQAKESVDDGLKDSSTPGEEHCNINAVDDNGNTALHVAAAIGKKRKAEGTGSGWLQEKLALMEEEHQEKLALMEEDYQEKLALVEKNLALELGVVMQQQAEAIRDRDRERARFFALIAQKRGQGYILQYVEENASAEP